MIVPTFYYLFNLFYELFVVVSGRGIRNVLMSIQCRQLKLSTLILSTKCERGKPQPYLIYCTFVTYQSNGAARPPPHILISPPPLPRQQLRSGRKQDQTNFTCTALTLDVSRYRTSAAAVYSLTPASVTLLMTGALANISPALALDMSRAAPLPLRCALRPASSAKVSKIPYVVPP